ncbi:MAG: InlB B-repeat-containing protein, partial [Acholeplasmatales bacterium]|nr:InlB B-repeat-containing protein [Acholeplasmatales bacterium]
MTFIKSNISKFFALFFILLLTILLVSCKKVPNVKLSYEYENSNYFIGEYKSGTKFSNFPVLTKDHYRLTGWYYDNEYKIQINTEVFKVNYDTIIYPKFVHINYANVYNSSLVPTTLEFLDGQKIYYENISSIVLNGNYNILGYYLDLERTNQITFPYDINQDITIYPHFEHIAYTINLLYPSGNQRVKIYKGDSLNLSLFSVEGYNVIGFYNDELYTSVFDNPPTITKDYDIYVKLEGLPFVVTFNYNGADGANLVTSSDVKYGNIYGSLPVPTKTNYYFGGWFLDADFHNRVYSSTYFLNLENITLYAYWVINPVINFDSNGGTYVETINDVPGSLVTFPTDPTKNGYTFAGWYFDDNTFLLPLEEPYSVMPNQTVNLYANWSIVTYHITYVLNGGTNDPTNPISYTVISSTITLKPASKTGYNFITWHEEANIPTGSYGDKTFSAEFWVIEYNIIYDLAQKNKFYPNDTNEDNYPAINNIANVYKYTIEDNIVFLDPSRGINVNNDPCYAFAGWYTQSDYINPINGITAGHYGDITIYAKWIYTITFYNGSSINEDDRIYVSKTYGTPITVPLDIPIYGSNHISESDIDLILGYKAIFSFLYGIPQSQITVDLIKYIYVRNTPFAYWRLLESENIETNGEIHCLPGDIINSDFDDYIYGGVTFLTKFVATYDFAGFDLPPNAVMEGWKNDYDNLLANGGWYGR